MSAITILFRNLSLNNYNNLTKAVPLYCTSVRYKHRERILFVEKPKPQDGHFRRIIHFPEEYTVEPVKTTHLAGRDPVTGRVVTKGYGGGVKHKYHWIKWHRDGPTEGPPQEEKVLEILKCGCRTGDVALVGSKDELKYILATVNMKPGDIIKSSKVLTKMPVEVVEGDSYPIGSLPLGTAVHNLQLLENDEYTIIHSAGCYGTIKRYLGGKVVVQIPERKKEVLVSPKCLATVGRVSNVEHIDTPIGSPQAARAMGYRPRSGLWHRKDGRLGRKVRAPPPLAEPRGMKPEVNYIRHTLPFMKL